MALILLDRVQETTATTGTGTITLAGAVSGFQSFAGVGNGNTCYYTIVNGAAWEVGIGTYSTTGPTLARTTVISNSSGTTSPITLAGSSTVFLTYPAEKAVALDASGNVTPLGTVASGTWQGSTVATAYGGTGVTSSSGASSNVLRDANSNITANNFLAGYNVITAAAGTTVLTAASAYYQRVSGSTTQTIQLPVATTMVNGQGFTIDNDSSGTVTVVDSASATIDTIPSGGYGYIFVENNTTSAGSWGKYALLPANYNFNTTTADFGYATISNATWQGDVIGTAYGGTGLTTPFVANQALYTTNTTNITTGTLPANVGGTGWATYSIGSILVADSSTTLSQLGIGVSGKFLRSDGSTPSWQTVNVGTDVGGTLGTTNGGTGASSLAGANIPTFSSADTFTNKRITPRFLASTANAATYALATDSYDIVVITAQSTTITSITTTGTPTNGQKLWLSITGTTSVGFTLSTTYFEASTVALPTTTSGTNRLDIGFVYNTATSKWRIVAQA
jgi:hypothetical protein